MKPTDMLPCEFCGFFHNHENAYGAGHVAFAHNRIWELERGQTRLESEIARLRKAIEAAPHGKYCRAKHICREYESGYCDCWKRNARESK